MNDEAVATVVGTLLVLALVVGAMTVYQLTVVPEQKERAEADHMDAVGRDMARLDGDLLRQVRGTSKAPLSSAVSLDHETPAFVPEPSASSTLSFQRDDHDATVASPNMKIVTRDGKPRLTGSGPGGEWNVVDDGETIEDITGLIGFRIKLTKATPSDNDRVRVTATDASGDYVGDFQVTTRVQPNGQLDLVIQAEEPPAPGTRVFHNHILNMHRDRWDADYWVDPLFDLYGFDQLLEDADKPATLTFNHLGLDAEYKVAYEKRVAEGLDTIVGAGDEISDYSRGFTTGTVSFDGQNEFYPDQVLDVEHGALVRSQAEGAAFLVDPPFTAKAGGGFVKLGLDRPLLEGDADSVSGTGTATVRTHTTEHGTVGGTAGEVTLTWGTDHPTPWAQFLEDELTDAGLTSQSCPPASADSDCQFEIQTTSSSVTLDLHGPHALDADPSNPERDIFLGTQRGTIQTEVRS